MEEDAARVHYRAYAARILDTLLTPEFLASETPGWEGLLKHGMYHQRKGLGVDESVMWGDYFLMEAVYRVSSMTIPENRPFVRTRKLRSSPGAAAGLAAPLSWTWRRAGWTVVFSYHSNAPPPKRCATRDMAASPRRPPV